MNSQERCGCDESLRAGRLLLLRRLELVELRLSVREWKARTALLDSAKWVSSPGGSVTWLEIDIERAARRERWKRASERVHAIRALRSFLQ